jgi:hypothetical protein
MDLSPAPRPPVALLVDAENLSKDLAEAALTAAARHGPAQVRRAYGNLNALAGWEDHGFRLCPTRPGKNAADMLLCVEAMALALRDGFDTLVIASSDRDFSYLAEHLREIGKRVIGLGCHKAPASFRRACTDFVLIAASSGPVQKPAPKTAPKPGGILETLTRAIAAEGAEGLLICRLGSAAVNGGFNVSATPEKAWRKWLEARGNLFVLDAKGPTARVRLRA